MQRIPLLLALLAVALVSACAQPQGAATGAASPAATAAAPFDQQFIDMMVPHHLGAVEMARIAQQRSQRPEIRAMADDVIRGQSDEIARMRQWRQAWFGSDQTPPLGAMPMVEGMQMPAAGGHGGHGGSAGSGQTMDMARDVEALRAAPEPFDRAFIDAMIPHHEDAVAAARAAETRARRQEIRELAQAVIRDQGREIAQMRAWRSSWFGG